jgi:F0F1-type ATP synthase epsilon subunit
VATILFELISPERALFSGEVRAVMLPAHRGRHDRLPGHEATMWEAFLHTVIFPERPEVAVSASLLSGVISTAILTMLGRDPF